MNALIQLRWYDWLVLMLWTWALLLLADTGSTWSQWLGWDARDHLGAEYDSIARALRSGRGFADPFREPTGPTAWMPPVLPYLLAGMYWLTGDDRDSVVTMILLTQTCVVFLTCAIVIGEARRLRAIWVGHLIVMVGLLSGFQELFRKTHDVWLNLLVIDLLWLGLVARWQRPQRLVYWGCLGGLAALCSPVLGGVWAGLTSWRWLVARRPAIAGTGALSPERWKRIRPLAVVAVISILLVLPWTVRNRVVMGSWMPIKSNGMFELWQSQCLDDDGVLDWRTTTEHPWPNNGKLRGEYRQMGEMEFIAHYATIAKQDIAAEPLKFLDRIAGRTLAATLWYMPYAPRTIWPVWLQRIIFPLPVLAALVLILTRRRLSRQAGAAIGITALALLPYALVSYYDRYAMPLIGMKMLIVLYAWHALSRACWLRPTTAAPTN